MHLPLKWRLFIGGAAAWCLAPHTAEGYAIAGITDQLGWNLYLDMPGETGDRCKQVLEPRVIGVVHKKRRRHL